MALSLLISAPKAAKAGAAEDQLLQKYALSDEEIASRCQGSAHPDVCKQIYEHVREAAQNFVKAQLEAEQRILDFEKQNDCTNHASQTSCAQAAADLAHLSEVTHARLADLAYHTAGVNGGEHGDAAESDTGSGPSGGGNGVGFDVVVNDTHAAVKHDSTGSSSGPGTWGGSGTGSHSSHTTTTHHYSGSWGSGSHSGSGSHTWGGDSHSGSGSHTWGSGDGSHTAHTGSGDSTTTGHSWSGHSGSGSTDYHHSGDSYSGSGDSYSGSTGHHHHSSDSYSGGDSYHHHDGGGSWGGGDSWSGSGGSYDSWGSGGGDWAYGWGSGGDWSGSTGYSSDGPITAATSLANSFRGEMVSTGDTHHSLSGNSTTGSGTGGAAPQKPKAPDSAQLASTTVFKSPVVGAAVKETAAPAASADTPRAPAAAAAAPAMPAVATDSATGEFNPHAGEMRAPASEANEQPAAGGLMPIAALNAGAASAAVPELNRFEASSAPAETNAVALGGASGANAWQGAMSGTESRAAFVDHMASNDKFRNGVANDLRNALLSGRVDAPTADFVRAAVAEANRVALGSRQLAGLKPGVGKEDSPLKMVLGDTSAEKAALLGPGYEVQEDYLASPNEPLFRRVHGTIGRMLKADKVKRPKLLR